MKTLYLDFETFSEVPIDHGTFRYAASAEIMLFAYAIDEGPARVWDITADEPMPIELAKALGDPAVLVVAHNAQFDSNVYDLSATAACWPDVDASRWRCTMAQALAHSLPGGLGKLCEILGVDEDQAKAKDGKTLIHLFCKPRPINAKLRRATRHTHPAEWERFIEYARLDIESMRAIHHRLPAWNYRGSELALWQLDQRINRAGFQVDRGLAESAIRAIDAEQQRLAERTVALTYGQVERATQRDKLLAYLLAEHDVALPDLTASTLEARMNDPELPTALRELLRVRIMSTTSSTSKYRSLLKSVSDDGRLRGTLQFCGALRTGRWAGRTFQPHNLPRPNLDADWIEIGIEAIKAGHADLLTDNVMELTSNAIRGCIIAAPGRKLVVSDLSNIEGRGLAYLAGEQWKLDAFRAYDAGTGPDLYKLAYARAFGIDPTDVTKPQRQIGKVMELSMGYQGGVGAFVTMVATYGMDLVELSLQAWPAIPDDVKRETAQFYGYAVKEGRTLGLPEDIFRTCDGLKRLWRRAHPATVVLWDGVEAALRQAIGTPGVQVNVAKFKVRYDAPWLRVGLPSGRVLCYPSPRIGESSGELSYRGPSPYTRRWSRIKTYGGKLVENLTQAFARDVLASSMPAIEEAGYPLVLTVHDEDLTEPLDDPSFNERALSALLATPPTWAPDIPLAAAGFEGYRYRKE